MLLAGELSEWQLVFRLVGRVGLGRGKNFVKFDVWVVALQTLLFRGGRFG
jgi:hypothetical protein